MRLCGVVGVGRSQEEMLPQGQRGLKTLTTAPEAGGRRGPRDAGKTQAHPHLRASRRSQPCDPLLCAL